MRRLTILLLLFLTAFVTYAKDLGNQGQTFAIREIDFDNFRKARLAMMQRTGKIAAYERAAIKRIRKDVYHPAALPLSTRTDTKTFMVNPSIRLNRSITDGAGKVLVPADTVVSPFKTIAYKPVLIFFNGDDPEQVAWVRAHYRHYRWVKFILTGGKLRDMAKMFGRIYFDQGERVAHALHITTVPAIAQQSGLQWKITMIGTKGF